MKPIYKNQSVRYVSADGTITDATVIDQPAAGHAHIQVGKNSVALAAYNEDRKTPNTFHLPDAEGGAAAAAPVAPAPKPFKPGVAKEAPAA